MKHGIYTGPVPRLKNKGALLRENPDNKDQWLAQFDATHLPEAFNWHPFDKKFFVNVE